MTPNRNHNAKSPSSQGAIPLVVFVSAAGSGIFAYLIGQWHFYSSTPFIGSWQSLAVLLVGFLGN